MKVTSVITTEIDLDEVYKLCKPISRSECVKAIRQFVSFQIDMMTSDQDGGWMFPTVELIAGELIQQGLAEQL